ncbi:MAG TPA: formate dehydrogenase subunit gamma [Steroidobacteraceae bacterium]|nr:formate dehydrogenase subunit gamma [Steroidobacteraceae bacterium]
MDKLVPEHAEIIRRVAADLKGRPGPLLEVLHAIQAQLGHVPPAAVPLVAAELNLSRAEVHGVISFYHYFRSRPPGAHTVSVCRAESCQAVGAEALAAHARQRLGVDFHETTPDGRFSLEPVYCLGNCACSPAVMIDGSLHGRVTPERLDALLSEADRKR